MDWFYDKVIDIYEYNDDITDEYGVSCDGWAIKKTGVWCDIQPTGIEKIKATYGYDIEANYKVFMDELLQESDIVLWNGMTFEIKKIIPWDDYNVVLMKEKQIKL